MAREASSSTRSSSGCVTTVIPRSALPPAASRTWRFLEDVSTVKAVWTGANSAAATWLPATLNRDGYRKAGCSEDPRRPRGGRLARGHPVSRYVLQRIQRGREDVEAGRIITQDEVEQRLARCVITGGASR
jgi:hypothetical protein